ncbi:MAG: hypothetical protein ACSNEK_03610 [Parachlamydiaceae bacterium]
MIAILLISMALPVLISSFAFIGREQQKMIQSMGMHQVANHAFSVVYEDLAMHKISYSFLEGSRQYPLEPRHLGDSSLWKGVFSFKKLKPDKTKEASYHTELWEVDFEFESSLNKEKAKFAYEFIVIRDLTHGNIEDKKNEKNS